MLLTTYIVKWKCIINLKIGFTGALWQPYLFCELGSYWPQRFIPKWTVSEGKWRQVDDQFCAKFADRKKSAKVNLSSTQPLAVLGPFKDRRCPRPGSWRAKSPSMEAKGSQDEQIPLSKGVYKWRAVNTVRRKMSKPSRQGQMKVFPTRSRKDTAQRPVSKPLSPPNKNPNEARIWWTDEQKKSPVGRQKSREAVKTIGRRQALSDVPAWPKSLQIPRSRRAARKRQNYVRPKSPQRKTNPARLRARKEKTKSHEAKASGEKQILQGREPARKYPNPVR